jgi:hypothetical protein
MNINKQTILGRPLMQLFVLLIWIVAASYISWNRSLWQDELMRFDQMQMSLVDALISLLKEPSPFAPGEILTAKLSQILFGSFTPFEFWARFPNVLWGAAALYVAIQFNSAPLTVMVFFSVAMASFSTQFRPYSQLIFAGAMGAYALLNPFSFNTKKSSLVYIILALLGHLYGICFMGLAMVLRRRWFMGLGLILTAFSWVYFYTLFHQSSLKVWQGEFKPYDWRLIYLMSLETLTDPYAARRIIAPAALLGIVIGYKKYKIHFFKFLFFSGFVVLSPLAANYFGNYWYVPRQIVAGVVPVLILAGLGYGYLIDRATHFLPRFASAIRVLALMALALAVARSWAMYVYVGRPSFAEQPLHKHKQNVQNVAHKKYERVLMLDPGGTGYFYFNSLFGPAQSQETIKYGELPYIKRSWLLDNGVRFTLLHFDHSPWAWRDLNELTTLPDFEKTIEDFKPQSIIYNSYSFNYDRGIPLVRCW